MQTLRLLTGALMLVMFATSVLIAEEPVINVVQWTQAQGGNDHWYGVINSSRPWIEHDSMAQALIRDGQRGYLATITSSEENQFITDHVLQGTGSGTGMSDYFLGLHFNGVRYAWITGEPTTFANWDDSPPVSESRAVSMWGLDNSAKIDPEGLLFGRWHDTPDDSSIVAPLHEALAVVEWGQIESPAIDSPYIRLIQWSSAVGGNGHWYALVPQAYNYAQHVALAPTLLHEGHRGYLATVTSFDENQFIFDNLITGNDPPVYDEQYYLGGIDDGSWKWVSGEPWSYTNWANGEPNNAGSEIALAMWGPAEAGDPRREPGKWNNTLYTDDEGWYHRQWAVVEWGGYEPPDSPDTVMVVHMTQWISGESGNDHWYGVIRLPQPWNVQDSLARTLSYAGESGYLATITSQGENDFITSYVTRGLSPTTAVDEYYLGATKQPGGFSWNSTEPMVYTNWDEGQPSGDGDRMALQGWTGPGMVGKWNDTPSDTSGGQSENQRWAVVEFGPYDYDPPVDSTVVRLVQWTAAEGGNDHWYGLIPQVISYEEHLALAPILVHNGVAGHLATITSQTENDFVYDRVVRGADAPSYDDQYYIGALWNNFAWTWVTDEPWAYTNWSNGEPNNIGSETASAMWGSKAGSDSRREPGKWNNTLFTDDEGYYHRQWAVVEFDGGIVHCGDVDNNGVVDWADLTFLLEYYFQYGTLTSLAAGDANRNGVIDLGDVTYLAAFLTGDRTSPCAQPRDFEKRWQATDLVSE